MVSAVRSGVGVREVARRFGVSPGQVSFWVKRTTGRRLDRVDFTDQPPGPRRSPYRVAPMVEQRILKLRRSLRETSVLGEYGADAIHEAWLGSLPCPSRTTINRVLRRHGVFDSHARQRYPAPPRGRYCRRWPPVRESSTASDLIQISNSSWPVAVGVYRDLGPRQLDQCVAGYPVYLRRRHAAIG